MMRQFYFLPDKTGGFIKKLWLFACFLLFSWGMNAQCPTGNVELYSQADVNNFATNYPNCTEITGYLYISGSTITDLSPLNNIQSIGGLLEIYNNSQLTNLDGLSNLTSIGADLAIYSNSSLTDISGLQNIDSDSILSTYYGVGLYIQYNPLLSVCNLDNFCTYLAGSGIRTISNNAGDCVSVTAVTTACNASSQPQCPTGDVALYSQADVNTFATNYLNCTEITGNLAISGSTITDLSPLSNIIAVTGNLYAEHNSQLTSLQGLHNIASVGEGLSIYSNPQLNSVQALSNITSLGGFLSVYNTNLSSLEGLHNITAIDGGLSITSNAVLTDISALENIDPETITDTGLYIAGNSSLSVCNLDNFCTYLAGSGARTISGNAGNCYESAVTDACLGIITYCTPIPDSTSVSYGIYINSFTTTEGITNINNTNSGFSANGYGNFSAAYSASQIAGESLSFSAVPGTESYQKGLRIWVDWNNDGAFANDSSEIVYVSPNVLTGTHNSSFIIPSDKPAGNYRMRVMMKYESTTIDPCEITYGVPYYSYFYGETEDYTLAVIEPCLTPTALTASNLTMESAAISWTSTGSSFEIEWGVAGFTQGNGTTDTTSTISYDLSGLDASTSYDFYVRQECNASSDGYSNWTKIDFTTLADTSCEIVVNVYGSGWGDGTWWSLKDASGTVVLTGGPYSYGYNDTQTYVATNPPYSLNFNITYGDNYASYSVTAGGTADIIGTVNYPIIIPLNTDLTACIPACPVPTTLTASNLTTEGATIGWTSTGSSFEIEWGTAGFAQGNGTTDTTATTSYDLSGLDAGVSYDFYVRQDCNASSDGYSNWVKYTFSTNDYCIPVPDVNISSYANNGLFIQSFTTSGSVNNINNTNSGFSANGYGNFSATYSASQIAGESLSFSAVPENEIHPKGLRIWVDWNNDGVFDNTDGNSEIVYVSPNTLYGTHNGSFTIPSDKPVGNYRMRVMTKYESTTIDPCEIHNGTPYYDYFYGETEDYTLTVTAPACPIPTALTASNLTMESATINWTNTGSSFEIEWGTAGFAIGNGTTDTTSTTSYDLSGLDAGTSYDFYVRQDCNALSDGYSNWVKYTFSTNDYCIPVPNATVSGDSYYGLYLSSFTTTNGETNINNANSGFSTNGYGNFSAAYSASQNAGESLSFSAVPGNEIYPKGLRIWVDWNNDGVFDNTASNSEIVYISPNTLYGTHNGSFTIPNDKPAGNYRMRVMMKYESTTIDPCEIDYDAPYYSYFYGETEDYTLTVLADLSGNCESYTIWNGTQWSNGTPDANKKAIIEGNLTLTGNMTACELLLNSGVLTVNSNAVLTVNGEIVNTQSEANFIVQSNANLIQVADVENDGAITVQRNTTIKHLDYTIWSSPVLGQKLKAFSPHTLNNRIRIYDTNDDTWKVIQNPETTNFVSGAGYMFRAPNVFDDGNYPNAYSWTGNFKGVPQNGNVTYDFDNAYGEGIYQSIGNPYPSNITYSGLKTANTGIGTLYFWTNTNFENGVFTGNNWATYSNLGGASADYSQILPNGNIAVGQGFVVETNGVIQDVNFNNGMRTSNSGIFFRTMTDEKHRLWLDLSANNQTLNQILVGYMDGATNSLDFGIDSKLFNYSGSALYSLIDTTNDNFVIQGRSLPFDDSDVVPLGFRATEAGSFTVSLSNFDGLFAENQDIFIKDNFTNTTHNLKNGSYTFVSENGTFDNRFKLVYREGSMSVSNPDLNNNWIVYKQNDVFHIQTQGFDMKGITVYDMLGRTVYTSQAEGNTHVFSKISADQVLIVKVTTSENEVMNKKVSN